MEEVLACTIAEIRALGSWCFVHGPEIWIGLCILCAVSIVILLGMWLAALLSANGRDEDENKRDLWYLENQCQIQAGAYDAYDKGAKVSHNGKH